MRRFDGGLLTLTHLTRDDYASTGADESYSEGVVDHLRSVAGTAVAGLVRDLLADGGDEQAQGLPARHRRPRRRLAHRARTGRRRPPPGGGLLDRHGVPASSSTSCARKLPTSSPSRRPAPDGLILVDKEPGITSHDVVARVRRRLGRKVKVGHAGTLDPFATGLLLVLVGRATRVQRFVMALPKRYEVVARLGWTSTTGDPEGELARGPVPAGAAVAADRDRAPAPAGTLGRQRRRRARLPAGAPRRGRRARPSGRSRCAASTQLWRDGERAAFAIECSSGTYVRSLVADLGDAYCLELRRTAIGDFDVADADPERIVPLGDALGFLPAVPLGEPTRRAGRPTAWRSPRRAAASPGAGTVRLLDDDGLIALAEPRPDGRLKPVVGFRG